MGVQVVSDMGVFSIQKELLLIVAPGANPKEWTTGGIGSKPPRG